MQRKASIVIPCWRTHPGLGTYLQEFRSKFPPTSLGEFILVLDGPVPSLTDGPEAELESDDVRVISLPRNFGQHAATLAGVHEAKFPNIITVDDDGEHGPDDALKLLEALDAGDHDVVYGVRRDRHQAYWRRVTSRFTKRYLTRVTGLPTGSVSSFRALRNREYLAQANMRDPYFNLDGFLLNTTGRIGSVEVDGRPSRGGDSRYRLASLTRYAWTLVTATTYAPLRAVTFAAGIAGITALILAIVFVTSYFAGNNQVAGFTAIATMTAFFGALQLLALGVLAEYLARIHGRTMGIPTYVLSDPDDL